MIVLRASELGMCFGVRDALDALDAVAVPELVTIHGELVHNLQIQRELDRRGFHRQDERDRTVPATPVVMITAHGVSDRERSRLRAAGKKVLDTTCPLVTRAHAAAAALVADDRVLVVLGKRDHVEVLGIAGDHDGALVVESLADVREFGHARLGVVCQTTLPTDTAQALLAAIRAANPRSDVRFSDTICSPTKARQQALVDLLARVDAVVVVGGRNSNNTRKLVASAAAVGVPALHVEGPDDVDAAFVRGRSVVGLTAGTSTPDAIVDAVEQRLRELTRAATL